ncbi:glycine--tRNA ligase [Patescibacteria group bacterium]|nr:glycine--tRNA ligase [Patescibacteria group bacterium]
MSTQPTLEQIVALAKRRGFVYPTSDIYGGLANSYDYGPVGIELLKNIRDAWWQYFITRRPDMVGLQSQILLHPQTWVASGHVEAFHDPLVEDLVTHKRFRVDHIIENWLSKKAKDLNLEMLVVEDMDLDEMTALIKKYQISSPDGNQLSKPKRFSLLFQTQIGSVTGEKSTVYLRGETAQGIFTNFKNVLDSTRIQLPFGVGNIGTSFRNEVTTGQFVFRTLEFELAEIEYFFDPQKEDWQQLMTKWKDQMWKFATEILGINDKNLKWRQHTDKERSHYSLDTWDLDFNFPFGYKELWGIAYRTDFDLKQHQKFSGQNMEYTDPHTQRKFIPHVIEPAVGLARFFLMTLCDAYWDDKENKRIVLKLKSNLAPYKAAVFPLAKNKPELVAKAKEIFDDLSQKYHVAWDDRSSIGKRYLYQDEIGTPCCITIDYETLEDNTVTARDRDTTQQIRLPLTELADYLKNKIE